MVNSLGQVSVKAVSGVGIVYSNDIAGVLHQIKIGSLSQGSIWVSTSGVPSDTILHAGSVNQIVYPIRWAENISGAELTGSVARNFTLIDNLCVIGSGLTSGINVSFMFG